jgi:hypothetical protein
MLAATTFLVGFVWLRSSSSFLQIEARVDEARRLAHGHNVTVPEAMAVLDLLGADAAEAAWREAIARYAGLLPSHGPGLAAVAMAGGGTAVAEALQQYGGAKDAAWTAFREREEALPGVRFLLVRDRFASRLDPADRGV